MQGAEYTVPGFLPPLASSLPGFLVSSFPRFLVSCLLPLISFYASASVRSRSRSIRRFQVLICGTTYGSSRRE